MVVAGAIHRTGDAVAPAGDQRIPGDQQAVGFAVASEAGESHPSVRADRERVVEAGPPGDHAAFFRQAVKGEVDDIARRQGAVRVEPRDRKAADRALPVEFQRIACFFQRGAQRDPDVVPDVPRDVAVVEKDDRGPLERRFRGERPGARQQGGKHKDREQLHRAFPPVWILSSRIFLHAVKVLAGLRLSFNCGPRPIGLPV